MPPNPDPIYTAHIVRIAYELRGSVAIFWKQPAPSPASWLQPLQQATEPDGVRILEHRFTKDNVSQFLVTASSLIICTSWLSTKSGSWRFVKILCSVRVRW